VHDGMSFAQSFVGLGWKRFRAWSVGQTLEAGVTYHSPNCCICDDYYLLNNPQCPDVCPVDHPHLPIKQNKQAQIDSHTYRRKCREQQAADLVNYPTHPQHVPDNAVEVRTRKVLVASAMISAVEFSRIPVGATLSSNFFAGSPQQHAILNNMLIDYFKTRARAQETTPYEIPKSQQHLLAPLGMEMHQPDAPCVPHGLHKSIEEFQLRRMRNYLSPNNYGVIAVKDSKLALLPQAGNVQNPVFQAKDVSRWPGSATKHASLKDFNTYFMHDVSSEVSPHELVEKLVAENKEAHLFVTGINPAEVLDRAETWEPSSHHRV